MELAVLLDENVDRRVLDHLGPAGLTGEHVVDAIGPGADDESDIAPYARAGDMVVVTKDVDFLAMDPSHHEGFLVNHRTTAFDIATAIVTVRDSFEERSDLRDVLFLDDWL